MQDQDRDKEVHLNQVTTRLETALLEDIYASTGKYNKFKLLLPTPGGSGTFRTRFKQTRNYAKIQAKTGTLAGQKALTGFAEISKGKSELQGTVIFSIIGDNLTRISSE